MNMAESKYISTLSLKSMFIRTSEMPSHHICAIPQPSYKNTFLLYE